MILQKGLNNSIQNIVMSQQEQGVNNSSSKQDPKPHKKQELKSLEDRLKEGVTLLLKLREVGITDTEPGFQELKAKISEWTKSDHAWNGQIEFARYGRYADVILPSKPGVVASMTLKMRR